MKNKKYSKWVAADTILNTTITTIDDKLFFDSLLNLICASSCRLIWKLRLLCFFTFLWIPHWFWYCITTVYT